MLLNLHDSAKEGNVEAVRELLGPELDVYLADVNSVDKLGKTPLCWAAEYGQLDVAELLLNRGADFSLVDLVGRKPLLWAARYGYKRIVQLLLDRGDSVDSKDKNGQTPLSLAAREGHLDVAKLLIKYGDEIDSKNVTMQTPLSFAAMNGHFGVVLLLLGMGANPDMRECSKNRSPLSFAAENGHIDVVKWLLAKDCEIESKDSDRRTPLSWAAGTGDVDIIEALISEGADVNSKDKDNRTPLSYASELGHTAVVYMLLQVANIEYDLQDNYYDQTPLSWAAERGHDEIVHLLLEMGADADSRDRAGHTPLLWAIRNGHEAVIELLLDQEVDVTARDEENWTPLSLATHIGARSLTQRLLLKAVELNSKVQIAIAEAIEDTLWRATESLLNAQNIFNRATQDPSLSKTRSLSKSPLSVRNKNEIVEAKEQAQAKEKVEASHNTVLERQAVVSLIIENNAYLNIKDYKERTLVSWAAGSGHDYVLELLLSRDLSPNSIDQLYRTPFSWAARGGHKSTLVILLDRQVHPDWPDGAGRTPLSLAAENGHEAVVKYLLDIDSDHTTPIYPLPLKEKPVGLYSAPQGSSEDLDPYATAKYNFEGSVDFDSRDCSGWTPLLFAAKEGHVQVVSLLLEKGSNFEMRGSDGRSLWGIIEDEIQSSRTNKTKGANLLDVKMLLVSKLVDGQLLTAPIEENASVDSQFKATVVHFLQEGKRHVLPRRCTVLDLLKGRMNDEVEPGEVITCKWLHVPANNMRWIEIIIANHYKKLRENWKHSIVLKKELWTGLQHRALKESYHARFIRPTCQALPMHSSNSADFLDQDSEEALKGLVLFMPYLHWETEDNVDEMKAIIRQHEMIKSGKHKDGQKDVQKKESSDYFKMKELVQAYLDDKHPLHIRRTLDQFYYYVLKDTNARDKDQTGSRFHRKFQLLNKNIITMVDQLWLWVLPGFGNSPLTVITSFPQRSNRVDSSGRRNDEKPTSLFLNIIAQTKDRPVANGYELAEIIASECSGIYFDTMTNRDQSLQFLHIYTTSISNITDKKTQCFDEFQLTLKRSKNATKLEIVSANALSIAEEIELLQEIKHIRDELTIMLSVFSAQRKALKDMPEITHKTGAVERRMSMSSSNRRLPRVNSWGTRFGSIQRDRYHLLPLSTVDNNIREVEDMDKLAERTHTELNHLLYLKQKQASVLEAQAARFQAERTVELTMATRNQGKMITFFTIITIVFMPLSFMAAFFAINISEFPRDANDGLSLAYVSKYTFSISAAIIVPSIIVAFHLQKIEDFFDKRKKGKSVGARQVGGKIPLAALKKQKLHDEEQGTESANSSF